jgi:hypothetical protein
VVESVPVEEPARRWMSSCASGGAYAPVEPAHRWRSPHTGGAVHRWWSALAGGGAHLLAHRSPEGRAWKGQRRILGQEEPWRMCAAPATIVESRDQAGPRGGRIHDDGVGR